MIWDQDLFNTILLIKVEVSHGSIDQSGHVMPHDSVRTVQDELIQEMRLSERVDDPARIKDVRLCCFAKHVQKLRSLLFVDFAPKDRCHVKEGCEFQALDAFSHVWLLKHAYLIDRVFFRFFILNMAKHLLHIEQETTTEQLIKHPELCIWPSHFLKYVILHSNLLWKDRVELELWVIDLLLILHGFYDAFGVDKITPFIEQDISIMYLLNGLFALDKARLLTFLVNASKGISLQTGRVKLSNLGVVELIPLVLLLTILDVWVIVASVGRAPVDDRAS